MKHLTRFLNALIGQKAYLPAPVPDPRSRQNQFARHFYLPNQR